MTDIVSIIYCRTSGLTVVGRATVCLWHVRAELEQQQYEHLYQQKHDIDMLGHYEFKADGDNNWVARLLAMATTFLFLNQLE